MTAKPILTVTMGRDVIRGKGDMDLNFSFMEVHGHFQAKGKERELAVHKRAPLVGRCHA